MHFRKTKVVCTIGPATWDRERLFQLADAGMNVARLNMSHGDHASHKRVVDLVKEYNTLGRGCVAIMLDTKGPEVRSGDLAEPLDLLPGDKYTFTIDEGANGQDGRISVNYDGFIDDVSVGDIMLVDGGLSTFKILSKTQRDVVMEVVDGGKMTSRRHLNIRGKSANLPAITDKDWLDLKFGIDVGVDYYALSFVRSADVIYELKEYLAKHGASIGVLAKIESAASVDNLESILDAVDGAMVARGDLGAELPVEEVPFWQSRIVQGCRRRGKPVIVATNMLESMITNPTPTRAEVSDIAIAVREGTDAVMLSGESAYGNFPYKAVDVMCTVAKHTEQSMLSYAGARRYGSNEAEPIDWIVPSSARQANLQAGRGSSGGGGGSPSQRAAHIPGISEMFAYHATTMANTIRTSLLVFTRKGNMPTLLSHYRPDLPIYAFTENRTVQRRLALYHGVTAIHLKFLNDADATFDKAIDELKKRKLLHGGQQVAIVQSGRQPIWRSASTHNISVRQVPEDPDDSDE
jgi:pyruvate kinase